MAKLPKPTVDINGFLEEIKNVPYASIINQYNADREVNGEAANIFITQRKQIQKQPAEQALRDCCDEWLNLPLEEKESRIWHAVILCLRTSRKNSGPDSEIQIAGRYVLDNTALCKDEFNTGKYAGADLKPGQRINEPLIWQTLRGQAEFNNTKITMRELVRTVDSLAQSGLKAADPVKRLAEERQAAEEFAKINGVGLKQSRNVLQYLGLTLYTIPLDSHVQKVILKNDALRNIAGQKWAERFREPIEDSINEDGKLPDSDLQNPTIYSILEDAVFEFCAKYKLPPAAFDALIMISAL